MVRPKSPLRSEFESAVLNVFDRYGDDADVYHLIFEFTNRGISKSTGYRWVKELRERRLLPMPLPLQAPPAPTVDPRLSPPPAAAMVPPAPSVAIAPPVPPPAAAAPLLETLLAYLVVLDDELGNDTAIRTRIHKRMRALCAGALAA